MKRARVLGGVATVMLAAGLAPGCMADTVEVGKSPNGDSAGAPPEAGGSGATEAGGRGGAGRGGTGARGGEAGQGAAGGKGGTSGKGGRGGSAGASASGGSGGLAGEGGDPRFSFDPACDCTAVIEDGWGEFSCTAPLDRFAQRIRVPSCDSDVTALKEQSCGTGRLDYSWSVGGENDYQLVYSADPKTIDCGASPAAACGLEYGYAFGYDLAAICDFSFTDPSIHGQIGTVRAGSAPHSVCADECVMCGSDDTLTAPCSSCTKVPGSSYAVTEPLESFCAKHSCPSTLEEARTTSARECAPPSSQQETTLLVTGCALIEVQSYFGFGGSSYYFDAATKQLVGASVASDTTWGECNAFEYRGGLVPTASCDDSTTCDFCTPPADGAAGAPSGGGAPGAGGAPDGVAPSGYPYCPPP